MAEETLKIKITADAEAAKQGLKGVESALKNVGEEADAAGEKVESGHKRMTASSQGARYAAMDLGHILRNIPYAMSNPAVLTGPLDRTAQLLNTVRQNSGGAKEALAEMKAALSGTTGYLLAFEALVTIFTLIAKGAMHASESVKQFSDDYISAMAGAAGSTAKETTLLQDQIGAITNVNNANHTRTYLLNKLKEDYPNILEFQKSDINSVGTLTEGYTKLAKAIEIKAQVDAYASLISDYTKKKFEEENNSIDQKREKLSGWKKAMDYLLYSGANIVSGPNIADAVISVDAVKASKERADDIQSTLERLKEAQKKVFGDGSWMEEIGKGSKDKKEKISEVQRILNALAKDLRANQKLFDNGLISKGAFYYEPIKAYGNALKQLAGIAGTEAANAFQKVKDKLDALKDAYGKIPNYQQTTADIVYKTRIQPQLPQAQQNFNAPQREMPTDRLGEYVHRVKDAAQAQKILNDYAGQTKQIMDFLNPAFDAMANAMEKGQDLGQALAQVFKDLVKQIAAAAVKALVFKIILDAVSGGSGIALSGIAQSGGSKGLGGFGSIFGGLLGFRAAGGPVSTGGGYVVGENGPEYFVPNVSGNIIPNSQMNSVSQTPSIFQNNWNSENGGQGGYFTLKGNDLVLALQRSNYSLNLRR